MSLSKRARNNIANLVFTAVLLVFLFLAKDFSPRAQFMPVVIAVVAIIAMLAEFYTSNFVRGMETGIDTAELFGADRQEEQFRQASVTAVDELAAMLDDMEEGIASLYEVPRQGP